MNRDQQLLDAALDSIKGGIPVFPCRPDKTPWTAHGFQDATLDPDLVRYWWDRWVPGANIAIPTGAVSGLVVIDVDMKNGVDGFTSWTTLMTELGVNYYHTASHVTPTGGFHLFHQHPGVPVGCMVGFAPGIDLRGDGGYVVIPPSTDTENVAYAVEDSKVDWFAPLPSPLLDLLTAQPPTSSSEPVDPLETVIRALDMPPVRHADRYVEAAFTGEVQRVMDTQPGGRNHALNLAAFKLAQIPDTDDHEIERALIAAASAIGLVGDDGQDRCTATIWSGIRAGRTRPRPR